MKLFRASDLGFRIFNARKWLYLLSVIGIILLVYPSQVLAAGIYPSGTKSSPVGKNFSVTVTASGAEFDSLQGTISVSGAVKVISIAAGGATWLPGKSPSIGGQFVGITSPTRSLRVATVTLQGTKIGKGTLTVSGVKLARNGGYVGSDGGSISFDIVRAPTPPGAVTVTSTTHPDQNQAYEATTVELAWSAPANGATGYSYVFNETADTAPEQNSLGAETSKKYENVAIGEHYFHIRAVNGDGWGEVTHFKISIKEPEAKVDESLAAPTINSVEKSPGFTNDVENGTLTGITIKGSGALVDFVMILSLDPKDKLPGELFQPIPTPTPTEGEAPIAGEGTAESTPTAPPSSSPTETLTTPAPQSTPITMTPLMTEGDEKGNWQITIDKPIPSGFYKLTAQGLKEKTLTPLSNAVKVEFSVAQGGQIHIITDSDKNSPTSNAVSVLGMTFKSPWHAALWLGVFGLLLLTVAGGLFYYFYRLRSRYKKLNQTG